MQASFSRRKGAPEVAGTFAEVAGTFGEGAPEVAGTFAEVAGTFGGGGAGTRISASRGSL
jgi:hypothetical protein